MKRTCKTHIKQRGFTMIEMVMVLIVLAIVSAIVIYRPTATGSNDLFVQTEILKSHLRYAQIKAMNDSPDATNLNIWGISIPNAGSYVLYKNNAQASIQLPGESAQTHSLPTGVTITSSTGTTYNFNEYGIPVDTGGSPIGTTQTITLSQGADTSAITITKNTGYIP